MVVMPICVMCEPTWGTNKWLAFFDDVQADRWGNFSSIETQQAQQAQGDDKNSELRM